MVHFANITEKFNNKRLFIFDFDETIINLNLDWTKLKIQLSALVKSRFSLEMTFTPIMEQLEFLRSQITKKEYDSILNYLKEAELYALREYSTVKSVGMNLLIDIYHRIVKLSKEPCYIALLSNNFTDTLRVGAKQYGIDSYISMYIGRDKVAKIKPDTEGLRKIHNNFPKVSSSEIIYFGDSLKYDKKVADEYGVDFYLITSSQEKE